MNFEDIGGFVGQFVSEIYEGILEINQDGKIQRQRIQAPITIMQQQFMGLVQQAANMPSQIKVTLTIPETIYDNFENVNKIIDNKITFMNNPYCDYHREEAGIE